MLCIVDNEFEIYIIGVIKILFILVYDCEDIVVVLVNKYIKIVMFIVIEKGYCFNV